MTYASCKLGRYEPPHAARSHRECFSRSGPSSVLTGDFLDSRRMIGSIAYLIPTGTFTPQDIARLFAGYQDGSPIPRVLHRFRFPYLQFLLPLLGSFGRVNSRLLISFFDEVSPALVAVCRILAILQLLQC